MLSLARSLLVALLVVLVIAAVARADDCGGNCPSGDCDDTCPCGDDSNDVDIPTWCSQFNGWDQDQCQCIANAESGGNANAMNLNGDGTYDVGLWQVNDRNWGQCNGGSAPCDPNANLNCAMDVWNWGGQSFRLWSTCSGCGACSTTVNAEWDGSYPASYNATRALAAAPKHLHGAKKSPAAKKHQKQTPNKQQKKKALRKMKH